ncbi:flagellar assembly protein FliW [Sutcliffiella horikoshii]|uniref:flagellar assembly protein FliW n=1 Tax=Sutcliffiella horikoshii TaxID=79883 RepID=UPI001F1FF63D|nr:flagellar assembly protein FliW [Sutcliffiella horikoshii]MCG1021585.1 flagellar assembly protein FliW [Sutcliffiella horikoshii]
MKIETKYHGLIEVQKEEVIRFPNGFPGFIEEKEFAVIPFTEDGTFHILQSVQTPGLGFALTNPFTFYPDYDFNLENQAVDVLELETAEDVTVYVVLTLADPFHLTTANLLAPVVVNTKNKLGKQVILTGSPYQTKHNLFPEAVAK